MIDLIHAKVGERIKFAEEVQRYTIRARSERYLICTKPFNVRKTLLYTIVDLEKNIRGTENLIFSMGAETDEECQEMLDRLEGKVEGMMFEATEVSYRNNIPLVVEEVSGG